MCSWVSLGVFAANNTRGAQVFKLERQEWVRYLQLRVLSHHGDEALCTLSQLKVHGMDVIEALNKEMEEVEDVKRSISLSFSEETPTLDHREPAAAPIPMPPVPGMAMDDTSTAV